MIFRLHFSFERQSDHPVGRREDATDKYISRRDPRQIAIDTFGNLGTNKVKQMTGARHGQYTQRDKRARPLPTTYPDWQNKTAATPAQRSNGSKPLGHDGTGSWGAYVVFISSRATFGFLRIIPPWVQTPKFWTVTEASTISVPRV